MSIDLRAVAGSLLLALAAFGATASAAAHGGPDGAPSCSSFASQSDAQVSFAELGGSASRPVGDLDRDRDGIACEGRPAPYAGYATLGYNRKGDFLYGAVSMPAAPKGKERFPCLRGNGKGPKGPRRLSVYRVGGRRDHKILGAVPAEAQPESGRLLWKVERATLVPGTYYVSFREAIPLTPYGRSECPRLPLARGQAAGAAASPLQGCLAQFRPTHTVR